MMKLKFVEPKRVQFETPKTPPSTAEKPKIDTSRRRSEPTVSVTGSQLEGIHGNLVYVHSGL